MARILIIGGGVAGLSAGIYALKNGHRVIICEHHSVVGGNLTGWTRNGYHIDNCIHWLTGTNKHSSLYKAWEELGVLGGIEILQNESLYTCSFNNQTLSLYRNLDRLKREMLALSLEDEREINAFIDNVKTFQFLSGIGGENHDSKANFYTKIKSLPTLYSYYKMTMKDFSLRFSSPLLREFFTCLLSEDFGAFAFLCVVAHYCADNGGLPRGGSLPCAMRMAKRFKNFGGGLLLNKTAIKTNIENNRIKKVEFEDGTIIRADYVIFTGDPYLAFGSLINRPLPKVFSRMENNPALTRFSSFQCAFSCPLSLVPFNADFIFTLSEKHSKILGVKRLILREFSHEPEFAPPHKTVLQALTFIDEKQCEEFISLYKNKCEYEAKKRIFVQAITEAICEHFPSLVGKIQLLDSWTPASYHRYVCSKIGSYMSFAFSSHYFPTPTKNTVKGIKNLVLATQWLSPPGGLPTAITLGKKASERVEKLIKKHHRSIFHSASITSRKKVKT